jgi:hypothetical protein
MLWVSKFFLAASSLILEMGCEGRIILFPHPLNLLDESTMKKIVRDLVEKSVYLWQCDIKYLKSSVENPKHISLIRDRLGVDLCLEVLSEHRKKIRWKL